MASRVGEVAAGNMVGKFRQKLITRTVDVVGADQLQRISDSFYA